jgi:putative tryptophan/tyrosine transport system substrate-binding protein
VDALRAGLGQRGWVEGRNLVLSLYWASGREDMDGVARALLASNPEVIVTQELMVYAVQPLQPTIPVIFGFSVDPVDGKLVDGLPRPGRNFTGMSYLALALVGKRIEFLKEWLPQLQHVAILAQPQHPGEQRESAKPPRKPSRLIEFFSKPDLATCCRVKRRRLLASKCVTAD